MPFVLIRIVRAVLLRRNLGLPVVLIGFVFFTSWLLMWLAEPAGSALVRPDNYRWWFLVTCSTVGYGDYVPTTTAGHVIGVYVIVGGIVALTTMFAQFALALDRVRGRRMSGSTAFRGAGHIVILGYLAGRTDRLVEELLADDDRQVVLGSWEDREHHPMPHHPVDFVRGDLTDAGVLSRAGVPGAHGVLVDARDDNESLAVAVTVSHLAPDVLLVVALRDLARATHVRYVKPDARCVQWHHPRMLAEELRSPGISEVYAELMTHGGGNTYSVALPANLHPVSFGDWQIALGRRYDATLIAARTPGSLLVGPGWRAPIPGGSVLYYISQRRLEGHEVIDAAPEVVDVA